ncbi:MAG: UDP-4-amino-4,6-dideoxy-N-acetyl-beta-L-altrosamine transaminase [Candidatus Pacebacteria bacterium]|nr:UDP-4-amino-4,6-dideoxy-N-acetyl-beta-L-altrosamine transaminase [Candidatus Paceibacterota bacterium]
MKKSLPYGHQWIEKCDIKEVAQILGSDWVTQGPKVEEFEKKVAKYCKAKYAVAVSSGTTALHVAYYSAGLKEGDEVITTPLTFAATSSCLVFLGAKPVFVDINRETLNIDPEEIEKKITKKTKAIAPVDFAGQPCNYDEILKIAKKHNLLVIEDAAHALGSVYNGKRVGGISDITILSFHPVKTITTGEGGMVLTNNKVFYERAKRFRNHGIVKYPQKGGWYYEIKEPAPNYRLTDIQCMLGICQLRKLEKFVTRRRQIVDIYNKAFKSVPEIRSIKEAGRVKSAWHIYPIQLALEKLSAGRKEIFERFQKEGIGVQVHYLPLHLHSFYSNKFNYKKGDFPNAEDYYERAITLPLFPKMKKSDIDFVIKTAKKIINNYKK